MATLFDNGIFSVLGINAQILVGAKLYWYVGETTTPATTYSDVDLTIPNTNPVVADATGRFPTIGLNAGYYKYVLTDASGVVLKTQDKVTVAADSPTFASGLTSFLAGTSALPIANGGTGSATAGDAITALGGLPTTGGTVTGTITRSTKGAHLYMDTAAMANGGVFLTAAAASDPTSLAGQIWLKY